MKIVVTGGAGFIGSTYVRHLLGRRPRVRAPGGAEVVVLDAFTYAGDRVQPGRGARRPAADGSSRATSATRRRSTRLLRGRGRRRPLRRRVARRPLDRRRRRFVRTNVLGTQTLLEAARAARVGRGSCTCRPTRCTAPSPRARGPETHAAGAELAVRREQGRQRPDRPRLRAHPRARRARSPAARTTTGRTSSPRRSSRCSSPTCWTAARCRSTATARNVRDWLHVDDHCRGIQLVLDRGRPGEVYNIGGGTELTNRELTERLLDACGADWSRVRQVPDRKGHDRRYCVDITKICTELGYAPQVPFDAGLAGDRRLVPRQPALVGAVRARARRAAAGVTAGWSPAPSGMLGRDAGRRPACRRRHEVTAAAAASWTSPTRPRSPRPWPATTSSSTARPGRPSTTPRRTRPRRSRSTRPAPPTWPRACAARGPARARLHGLRVRRRPPARRTPRTPRWRRGQRVRADKAAGEWAVRALLPGPALDPADGVALRRARAELRPDHGRAWRRGATPSTSSTTRPVSRPGRCDVAARVARACVAGRARRRGPTTPRRRADDLVRAGAGGVRAARRGPGPGAAHHARRVRPAGTAAGVVGAGARGVAAGGTAADAGLGGVAAAGRGRDLTVDRRAVGVVRAHRCRQGRVRRRPVRMRPRPRPPTPSLRRPRSGVA